MDRFAFLLKRPVQLIPVIIGISLITFILIQLTPGDPVRIMLGPKAPQDAVDFVRARYGLDQPVLVQYFYFVLNALRGDFGQSIIYRSSVGRVILDRIEPTLYLILYGLALSVAFT